MHRKDLLSLSQTSVSHYLKQHVIADQLHELETEYHKLLKLCKISTDRDLLKSCFHTIEFKGIELFLPRKKVKLTVQHIMRLLDLGFKLGKVDTHFEVRTSKNARRAFINGNYLPEDKWNQKYECVLKHAVCHRMSLCGKFCLEEIQKFYKTKKDDENKNEVEKAIIQQLETIMFSKRGLTKTQLNNPPKVKSSNRFIRDIPEKTLEFQLSENAKLAFKLQYNNKLPSIYDAVSLNRIREIPQAFVILLDISSSTAQQEIHRFATISCASVLKFIKQKIPRAAVWVLPYHDIPLTPLLEIKNFLTPSGTTSTDLAFQTAQSLLKPHKGYKAVIHITDGLPNDLSRTILSADKFPEINIQFGQIVFGHTERLDEIAEHLLDQLKGNRDGTNRYEKYISHFSKVTEAAQGSQLVVWMLEDLTDAMISLSDLTIALNFLENHEQFRHLLDSKGVDEEVP